MSRPLCLLALFLLSCNSDSKDTGDSPSDDTSIHDTGASPMSPLFSFAIVADPHITGDAENETRLAAALARIAEEAGEGQVELVFVVGDIAWGDGYDAARTMFDSLPVPYVPIIGDNEINGGDEAIFDTEWASTFDRLSSEMENWTKAPNPVSNAEAGTKSWFQNYSFDYRGIHFMNLDWCSRINESLYSELPYLHDFEGGTFPWFEADMAATEASLENSVMMMSHHPMSIFGFNNDQLATIASVTLPMDHQVSANHAGHLHANDEQTLDGGYDVIMTDATQDDEDTVRFVRVESNELGFAYTQELVVVDWK